LVYRKRKDSLDLPGHFNIQSIPALASSRLVQDRFTRKEEEKKPQSEFSHLGIGSFIIKKLVEAHSGTISASSTAVAGTTFVVSLPCHQSEGG